MKTLEELSKFFELYYDMDQLKITKHHNYVRFYEENHLNTVTFWDKFCISLEIHLYPDPIMKKELKDIGRFMDIEIQPNRLYHNFILTDEQKLEYHMMYFS